MDDKDENLTTFLAYTKSPKTTKRTSFQDELKKAVSARVSRQQAVENADYSDYSEEFESDDSSDESVGKNNTIESKVQKDLQHFHSSDEEVDPYGKTSFLKESQQAERSFRKHSDKSRSTEDIIQADYEDSFTKLGLDEVKPPPQIGRKPIPKPRESKIKSSSSSEGFGIALHDEIFKPTAPHSHLSGRSSHLEDKAEGKYSSDKPTSLSAPSSLMRLNDKVSASKTQFFSERSSPEGHWLSSAPSPTARFKSLSIAADEMKEEEPKTLKDLRIQEVDSNRNKESTGDGRKSPSLFDMMISDVKEKCLHKDPKEAFVSKSPGNQFFGEKRDDGETNEQHGQLDHQKNLKATLELGRSHSNRSFSAQHTKKSPKRHAQVSAKSRYLGTLTLLDTSVNKDSGDVEAADRLRATVYQNWLEKKKIFLHELQKLKKADEHLKKEKVRQENTMKKEEAMAAFMAWKAEKKKEGKNSQAKKKMEEMKKMEEIQEIACRKADCRKAFEKWKEAKEDNLKEKVLKEKHVEVEKKKKEQKALMEKKQENLSAFERWSDRKEHVIKEKKNQDMLEKQKLKTLQAEREEKEKIAMEKYEQWLEKKDRKEKTEKKQKKLQVILDNDTPPWSPPGKTIPAGR